MKNWNFKTNCEVDWQRKHSAKGTQDDRERIRMMESCQGKNKGKGGATQSDESRFEETFSGETEDVLFVH
jgi:hypothetical protein